MFNNLGQQMKTLSSKFVVLGAIGLVLTSAGCSSTQYSGYSSTPSATREVYNTSGQRIAHIDGQGNVYATMSSKGIIAGQRVGRIGK